MNDMKERVYEAKINYMNARNRGLLAENEKLLGKLTESHKINKWLWMALSIMSLLTLIQSLVLFNG